jgi:hypothetical protein
MKTKPKRSTRTPKATSRTTTTGISARSRPKAIGQWLAMKEAAKPGFTDAVFRAYSETQAKQTPRVATVEPRTAAH